MDENQAPAPGEVEATGKAKGGKARAAKLTPEQRKQIASIAAQKRWQRLRTRALEINEQDGGQDPGDSNEPENKINMEVIEKNKLPTAKWPGVLSIGDTEIPVYVLNDGRRIISRTGATTVLTDGKGGGNLESYILVKAVEQFIPANLADRFIEFEIQEVVNKSVRGMEAETFLEICGGYVRAWQSGSLTSEVQIGIAMRSAMFLAACSKVGLIALIDEATGYQFSRAEDELRVKLKLFLLEEMRKWEKTFPDELWIQFGRLTNWKGGVNSRPKYWGRLVMELIYEYLDADVAQWLKENAPQPVGNRSYHRWLSEQYGLKKLVEHIWKVIGVASTCETMKELQTRMQELYGNKKGFQFQLKLMPAKE